LETQMPEAVCSKCGTRYVLAIQSGSILIRSKLVEVTRDVQPMNITVPSIKEHEVRETIIKEVVKIPCRYCGSLVPQSDNFCSHCGGRRQ
jgi:rRNA maturation endonuclease Nob1